MHALANWAAIFLEDVDTVLASNFGNEGIRKCASSPETFCQPMYYCYKKRNFKKALLQSRLMILHNLYRIKN